MHWEKDVEEYMMPYVWRVERTADDVLKSKDLDPLGGGV